MTVKCFRFAVVCVLGLQLSACANSSFSVSEWFNSDNQDDTDMLTNQASEPEPAVETDSGVLFRKQLKEALAKKHGDTATLTEQEVIQYRTPNTLYSPNFSHKSLSDYAEQLTMNLIKNGRKLSKDSLVGVTTFVNFDQTLKKWQCVR